MNIIEYAVAFAIGIAQDDAHGYDQNNRWGPDYDCSSLLIQSWHEAFKKAGKTSPKDKGATYTGNMKKAFLACGFKEVPLASRQYGDILLNEGHHTAMMIDSKNIVQASINEQGKIVGGKKGDQNGREIQTRSYYVYSKGWDCCLRYMEDDEKPSEPVKEETKPTYYIVVYGDTLTKIAKKFGTTVAKLVEWNGIKDKNKINAGQKLRVIAPEQTPAPSAPTAPQAPATAAGYSVKVTSTSGLNVRAGTSTSYAVTACLNYGDVVKVLEVSKNWGRISRGWICLDYTKKV